MQHFQNATFLVRHVIINTAKIMNNVYYAMLLQIKFEINESFLCSTCGIN